MKEHNNQETFLGGTIGFIVSLFNYVDWHSVLNTILCTIVGIIAARAFKHFFPDIIKKP